MALMKLPCTDNIKPKGEIVSTVLLGKERLWDTTVWRRMVIDSSDCTQLAMLRMYLAYNLCKFVIQPLTIRVITDGSVEFGANMKQNMHCGDCGSWPPRFLH